MWMNVRDLYYLTAVGLGEMARLPGLRKIVVGTGRTLRLSPFEKETPSD